MLDRPLGVTFVSKAASECDRVEALRCKTLDTINTRQIQHYYYHYYTVYFLFFVKKLKNDEHTHQLYFNLYATSKLMH